MAQESYINYSFYRQCQGPADVDRWPCCTCDISIFGWRYSSFPKQKQHGVIDNMTPIYGVTESRGRVVERRVWLLVKAAIRPLGSRHDGRLWHVTAMTDNDEIISLAELVALISGMLMCQSLSIAIDHSPYRGGQGCIKYVVSSWGARTKIVPRERRGKKS